MASSDDLPAALGRCPLSLRPSFSGMIIFWRSATILFFFQLLSQFGKKKKKNYRAYASDQPPSPSSLFASATAPTPTTPSCSTPWPTTRSTRAVPFTHELVDIETLNRRAFAGELELTAVSLHAYAYLTDNTSSAPAAPAWATATARWSSPANHATVERLAAQTIAVPGTLTTAFLALRLCLGKDISSTSSCRSTRLSMPWSGRVRGPEDRRRADHPRRSAHLRRQQA